MADVWVHREFSPLAATRQVKVRFEGDDWRSLNRVLGVTEFSVSTPRPVIEVFSGKQSFKRKLATSEHEITVIELRWNHDSIRAFACEPTLSLWRAVPEKAQKRMDMEVRRDGRSLVRWLLLLAWFPLVMLIAQLISPPTSLWVVAIYSLMLAWLAFAAVVGRQGVSAWRNRSRKAAR